MIEDFKIDINNKEEVIKWLNKIREGSGNAIPLWKAVTPKIIEFVNYELDPNRDTHKLWPRLNVNYLLWKIRVKHVSGIGYLTGAMRTAAGEQAIKQYSAKSLIWKLDPNVPNENEGKVGDYVNRFHYGFKGEDIIGRKINQKARPLYKYTSLRINNFLKLDAKRFNDGIKHANFTYAWLRKSLEAGQQ